MCTFQINLLATPNLKNFKRLNFIILYTNTAKFSDTFWVWNSINVFFLY